MVDHTVGRPWRAPSHRRVLLTVVALLLTLAGPARAEDGAATYGARPAPGPGDRSSASFDLSVGSGSAVSDAVEILNFRNDPASFDVYVADVVPTSGGGLAPAARDVEITGPAAWITVDQATVQVPARSGMTVPFTVDVPEGTPLGDHTAALLVEPLQSADTGSVGVTTRVGLWVKVNVTQGKGEVPGGVTSWGTPWLPLVLLGFAFLLWLTYATRERRYRWVQERREELALVRDLRNRRRHKGATGQHR